VLLGQESRIVVPNGRLAPRRGFRLFLVEFFDDAFELKDLVINGIHLVLIFKQVVLVDILNLKLVVLRATRLDTVTIVENLE